MEHFFLIPETKNDIDFFKFIINFYFSIKKCRNKTFFLNFINIESSEQFNLAYCSVLSLIIDRFRAKNKITFKYINMNNILENSMLSIGFLTNINSINSKKTNLRKKFMLYKLRSDSLISLQKILKKELHNLKITETILSRELIRCLLEISKNAAMHGNSPEVYLCGNYENKSKILTISISNFGWSFKKNYRNKTELKFENNSKAIEYSLEADNTSRNLSESGGIGLKVTRKFITENSGTLSIFSGDGICLLDKANNITIENYNKEFSGSVVILKVKITSKFIKDDRKIILIKKETSLESLYLQEE